MKRITSIICVILVLLTVTLAACSFSNNKNAGNKNADGTYRLTKLIRDGVDDSDEIAYYSKEQMPIMVIKGDKATVSSLVDEDDVEIRTIDWNKKTMTADDGDVATFELNGNKITYNVISDGIEAEFTKN